MFAAALSSVTSALSSSIKDTASSYKPTQENINGSFERLAQLGIGNLSFRSPLMADVAEQVLKNFQITVAKKQKLREFISSDGSNTLREKVKSKLPESTSSAKIDVEMMRILDKLDKQVDISKDQSYKQSDLFKEYEEQFKAFKKHNAQENPPQSTEQPLTSSSGFDSDVLSKIQVNTQRTYNAIEVLASQQNVSGSPNVQQKGSGVSFVDPMTGLPSMRAAIGSIGGSFLGKIFDDELITKYANKVKTKFGFDEDNEPIPDKQSTEVKSSETIKELETVKNKQSDELKTNIECIIDELIDIHKTIRAKTTEGSKSILGGVFPDLDFPEISKRIPGAPKIKRTRVKKVPTKIIDAVSALPDIELNKTPSTVDDVLSKSQKGAGYGSKALQAAKGFGSRALGLLNPVTKVAAAGAAGYAAGTVLNEGISSAINWTTDGKSQSLGDWIYNKTHPEENKLPELRPTATAIKTIAALNTTKENMNTPSNKQINPIVLNTTNNTQQTQNPVVITGTGPVRNKESTFERVQMQDFWSRSA